MNRENTQIRTFGGVDMTKFETIRRKGQAGDWNQQKERRSGQILTWPDVSTLESLEDWG